MLRSRKVVCFSFCINVSGGILTARRPRRGYQAVLGTTANAEVREHTLPYSPIYFVISYAVK